MLSEKKILQEVTILLHTYTFIIFVIFLQWGTEVENHKDLRVASLAFRDVYFKECAARWYLYRKLGGTSSRYGGSNEKGKTVLKNQTPFIQPRTDTDTQTHHARTPAHTSIGRPCHWILVKRI
jgi:hypothetical protein